MIPRTVDALGVTYARAVLAEVEADNADRDALINLHRSTRADRVAAELAAFHTFQRAVRSRERANNAIYDEARRLTGADHE